MTSLFRRALVSCWLALGSGGCGLIEGYRQCADVEPLRDEQVPSRLSDTGLFADVASDTLAPGVRAYRPAFELWSDGATKRRWIALPRGARIDTANMDEWSFPVGTKLWKEFTRDGVRVETRLLQRTGPGPADWAAIAYLWNAAGTDAVAVEEGVQDARGTSHDVPAASECWGCHGGRRSRVLGFSAVQILDLSELVAQGALTVAPAQPRVAPTMTEGLRARGYLHANCSHCHNQTRPPRGAGARCFDPERTFDFSLHRAELVDGTAGELEPSRWDGALTRGRPGDSALIERMSSRSRFPPSMPPLGTERVDHAAVDLLTSWIESL